MVLGGFYSTLDKANKVSSWGIGMNDGEKGNRFENYIVNKISKLQLRQKLQEGVIF